MAQPLDPAACAPIIHHVLYSLAWSAVATGRTPAGIAEAFNDWFRDLVRESHLPVPFPVVFDIGMLLTRRNVRCATAQWRGGGRDPRSQETLDAYREWVRWLDRTRARDTIHQVRQMLARTEASTDRGKRNAIVRLFFRELLAPSEAVKAARDHGQWAFAAGVNSQMLLIEGPEKENVPFSAPNATTLPPDLDAWPPPQSLDGESARIEAFLSELTRQDFTEDTLTRLLFLCNATLHMENAANLLDDALVNECVRYRPLASRQRHIVRTRPTHREMVDKPSKLEGIYNGVTKVERKQDVDPLWNVLPGELAYFEADEIAGLDHLVNRSPLFIKHESPEDIVPERRVLVCFVVDTGGDDIAAEDMRAGRATPPSTIGRALSYAMVWDAAERVPRREMALSMAVYQFQPDRLDRHLSVRSSLFPLPLAPRRADNYHRLVVIDDTVPEFYYKGAAPTASRSSLDPDPFRFLERELVGPRWHSVYAVLLCAPRRFATVLSTTRVMLRHGFQHRDGLVLIGLDPHPDPQSRRHRAGSFRTFQEGAHAATRGQTQLPHMTEEEARELFLATVIGKPAPRRRAPVVLICAQPGFSLAHGKGELRCPRRPARKP
ncbi:MAG: hypothetical protein FJ290_20690 [Planctomycetes bacterium]|nr:hypothetical protein [Planctomycetota bacterium]